MVNHINPFNMLDDLMQRNYLITILKVKDDGATYYRVAIPDLPGLVIYVDAWEDIATELRAAKGEWFFARLQEHKNIPLPTTGGK